jgi:small subunit ribosomal protein S13
MEIKNLYKKNLQNKVNINLKEFNKLTKIDINLEEFNKLFEVYGAKHLSKRFLINILGYNSRLKFAFLKTKNLKPLQDIILESLTGKKLTTFNKENIDFIQENRTYKGLRHKLSLPVRGQRTHTNAKTSKKKRNRKAY